jgi:two-component system, chemotaxis family, chemotaxis protein CheY
LYLIRDAIFFIGGGITMPSAFLYPLKQESHNCYTYPYKGGLKMATSEAAPKIIIADDIYEVRATYRKMLVREGYNIVGEAEDGDEVEALVQKLHPDLVIMDYNMKRMNGLEAIKKLKKLDPGIRIIMITGAPSPSLVAECIKAGASNFLSKPFDKNHFLHLIKRLSA